ncbi:hypothetical protein B5M47_02035 [candidate division CPR3 bacterium 4484_211]|uniref:PEP-utilising enzyme mobile domain-containing protein n=1 Tax=candidate division CPR3 bacterium 4484_211 TaxID=1968527 RepID=A0A1W9NZT5_UNCC3|nr:MAG: hypothetical protein B5M47_02035 [candidate division CPR3 bacterium 4484_211]
MIKPKKEFRVIWDKTNIGENYPGITLPLTYSFIKDAYSHVYSNFMSLVAVDKKTLEAHQEIFDNLIGYVKGEVFYNINNWYKLLKLLPGYLYNRRFFENMLNPVTKKSGEGKEKLKFRDFWNNRKILFKLIKSILLINSLHKRFDQEFYTIYQKYKREKLSELDNFQLVSLFKRLEREFFPLWGITIVNDFKVMVYLGLLTEFSQKHTVNSQEILKTTSDIEKIPQSIAPLKSLKDIVQLIKSEPEYVSLFAQDNQAILERLPFQAFEHLNKAIETYINNYGERTRNELKLEETNFKNNPAELIALLKHYLKLGKTRQAIKISKDDKSLLASMNLSFLHKFIFNHLKNHTVSSVRKREYYRLKRAKVFNIAREIFMEIGRRLKQAGDIKATDDIFYLYKDEIFDYVRFHRLRTNFHQLISQRKKTLSRYAKSSLSQRIKTQDLPNSEKIHEYLPPTTPSQKFLVGQPTSRGQLKEAEVVVMNTLDLEVDVKNKVLVTQATDPGWTIIFPLLKGVITEQGGMLSHASVVARELRLPCIVAVPNATKVLKTGDKIEMDAIKGQIRKLN